MEKIEEVEERYLHAQNQLSILSNYQLWPLEFVRIGQDDQVWDSSAGIGLFSMKIINNCKKLLITEFSKTNLDVLEERFNLIQNCIVKYCDLTNIEKEEIKSENIDIIFNLDVLEHLEDDQKVLNDFYTILNRNGKIVLKVPAHKKLYCDIDRKIYHYRRYSKAELTEKIRSAGFTNIKVRYINPLGAVSYFIKGKILNRSTNFSNTFSKNKLTVINLIVPFMIRLERLIPSLFGLSLVAVAEKK
jgi:2-polyprenyl-3-methyl-5-hydroxy-6-metoxy-1,4-benzoquinol methylase